MKETWFLRMPRSQWANTNNSLGRHGKGSSSLPEAPRTAPGANERHSRTAPKGGSHDANNWTGRPRGKGRHAADDLSHTEQTAFAVAFAAIDDLAPPIHNPSLTFKAHLRFAQARQCQGGTANAAVANSPPTHTACGQNGSVEQNGADEEENILEHDEQDVPENPGSVGHPELCPRPCLYFASGRCANGTTCNFCHLPHPKRPAHLDKRHRIMLKEMSFQDCLCMMLPILRQKLSTLACGPSVTDLLDSLEGSVAASQVPAGTQALQTALRAMSLRSLLTALHRQALPQISPEQAAIDCLLQQLRFREEEPPLQTGLRLTSPPYAPSEDAVGGPWANEDMDNGMC